MLYIQFEDNNIENFVKSSLNGGAIEVPNSIIKSEDDLEILNHVKNYISATIGKDRSTLGVDKVNRVYEHAGWGMYTLHDTKTHVQLYEGVDMSGDNTVREEETFIEAVEEEKPPVSGIKYLLLRKADLLRELKEVESEIRKESVGVEKAFAGIYEKLEKLEDSWQERLETVLNNADSPDDNGLDYFVSCIEKVKTIIDKLLVTDN